MLIYFMLIKYWNDNMFIGYFKVLEYLNFIYGLYYVFELE